MTAIVIVLTTINYLGVRHAARMSNVFAVMKLVPLAMFVLVGIWFIEPGHFQFQPMPNANTLALAIMVLIFAFSGFEVATINAGEVQNPEKAFPYALFVTVALVLVFYLAIQIVAIGTLPSLATSSLASPRIFLQISSLASSAEYELIASSFFNSSLLNSSYFSDFF